MFKKIIKIKVTGHNVKRFIKRINKHKINIYNLNISSKDQAELLILKNDFEEIQKFNTIYKVDIIGEEGFLKLRKKLIKSSHILFFLLIGYAILLFLSNIIFDIDIIHTNNQIVGLLEQELEENGIKKFSFKKSYNELQKIKKSILEKYRDKIEWLEIVEDGTKYIIRVEERIITEKETKEDIKNIVATKSAIILKINAKTGIPIKNRLDYVKKGDVIISSEVKLNDEIKQYVNATGEVFGEVWYKVSVEYPFKYYEKRKTGKRKKVLSFYFLGMKFELFNFSKFTNYEIQDQKSFKHFFLPIKLALETQEEVEIINEKYTKDEALQKAILKATDKLEDQLSYGEYIISKKKLKVESNSSRIIVDLFFTVCENITGSKREEMVEIPTKTQEE